MAASVAGLMGLSVLIQAMTWLGLPEPPVWKLVTYFLSIGMFGVGVGMLYTPLLVDRMRLSFPSGYAVANILRALTDLRVLKRSITTLGGGIAAGIATSLGGKNTGEFTLTIRQTDGAPPKDEKREGLNQANPALERDPPVLRSTPARPRD